MPPKIRKHESVYEKHKKKNEELTQSQREALKKFIIKVSLENYNYDIIVEIFKNMIPNKSINIKN